MIIGKENIGILDPRETDLRKGAVFLIDKPINWTSFDVVNKLRNPLRRSYFSRKFKVGHAGTLDPLAVGLLIVCIGNATKSISEYMHLPKVYEGEMKFGATTPSYDAETEENDFFDTKELSFDKIKRASESFLGTIEQVPPMYSAIKVNGKPLYKLARNGKSVHINPRTVNVYDFNVLNYKNNIAEFNVRCSKGTYIRSLVHDLGRSLNNGAYLTGLSRTQIGEYKLEDAWNINELVDIIESKYVRKY